MIRRQVEKEYWLITQHDHAAVSGEMARRVGNLLCDPPSGEPAFLGIALHDCGWPLHDDQPTLNNRLEPLDVFEAPRPIALAVWKRSVEIAMERDPYAGLLVSVHVLTLSTYATQQRLMGTKTWDLNDPRVRFEVNVFQHRMIEIQEGLRGKLGLRLDRPLKNGLALNTADPAEQRLNTDFIWLQAMDMMSLAICCTEPPFAGHSDLRLSWKRQGSQKLCVKPWPFEKQRFEVQIPFRRLPAKRFAGEAELHEAIRAAPAERFTVSIQPNTI